MAGIGDEAAFRLRPDVVATVLDGGALLLDLESKYFYLLNRAAGRSPSSSRAGRR